MGTLRDILSKLSVYLIAWISGHKWACWWKINLFFSIVKFILLYHRNMTINDLAVDLIINLVKSYSFFACITFHQLDFLLQCLIWAKWIIMSLNLLFFSFFTQSLTCGTGFYSSKVYETVWKGRKLVLKDKETGELVTAVACRNCVTVVGMLYGTKLD